LRRCNNKLEDYHQIPRILCNRRLTAVIPIQQQNPIMIGLPPDFISFTMFVFKPIATIARMIKNLLSSLNGANIDAGTPKPVQIVVIREASIKNMMKKGKIFLKSTFLPSVFFSVFVRINASISVMGIMARVLVSLTVTALSRVAEPKLYILSHVEAAAVTEEVSLIAVPAKTPKAPPEV